MDAVIHFTHKNKRLAVKLMDCSLETADKFLDHPHFSIAIKSGMRRSSCYHRKDMEHISISDVVSLGTPVKAVIFRSDWEPAEYDLEAGRKPEIRVVA